MKILFVTPSKTCFESLVFFTDLLAKSMNEIGVEVIRVDTIEDIVKNSKNADGILVFNGNISLKLNENVFFFEHLGIPVINFIVDHPRMHYHNLVAPINKYYVVCLDEDHREYILEYYQHIQGIQTGWLYGGEGKTQVPYENRKMEVLFIGSYGSENKRLEKIKGYGGIMSQIAFDTIEHLLSNTNDTIEIAMNYVLSQRGIEMSPLDFIKLDSVIGTDIDYFLRAYYRHLLIATLSSADIPITLCGSGWDLMDGCDNRFIRSISPIPFAKSISMMTHSKVVLNINPWFKKGIHDRVITALYNHTVCATDNSHLINDSFASQEDLITFSLSDMKKTVDEIREICVNKRKWDDMTQSGYEKVRKTFEPHELAKDIGRMIAGESK